VPKRKLFTITKTDWLTPFKEIILLSRWRQYVSLKCWHLPMNLHGIKTQNIIILVLIQTGFRGSKIMAFPQANHTNTEF
jgi:hypothetical protein